MVDNDFLDRRLDNEHCPRFVALAAGDDYAEADDDLEELIAELLADDAAEEYVIWKDMDTVAAVVRADGSVLRLDPVSAVNRQTRRLMGRRCRA
jgi:hypothetical protein